jgi:putative hydrolase of the HAD superfamily
VNRSSLDENLFQKGINAVLFDMDNTLFDLVGAQIAACNSVVSNLGQIDGDELFLYFLESSHGFESTENIRQYMEERRIPTNGMFEHACRIYHQEKLRHIIPYPGVRKTLEAIQDCGYAMAIVTDAEYADARIRLDKCGLLSFFDTVVTFDRIGVKKPAHEPFFAALDAVGAKPSEALFVGDSPRRDIEPCRKLGIRTVYARYGDRFSKTRDSTGSNFTIDKMEELLDIVKDMPVSCPRSGGKTKLHEKELFC